MNTYKAAIVAGLLAAVAYPAMANQAAATTASQDQNYFTQFVEKIREMIRSYADSTEEKLFVYSQTGTMHEPKIVLKEGITSESGLTMVSRLGALPKSIAIELTTNFKTLYANFVSELQGLTGIGGGTNGTQTGGSDTSNPNGTDDAGSTQSSGGSSSSTSPGTVTPSQPASPAPDGSDSSTVQPAPVVPGAPTGVFPNPGVLAAKGKTYYVDFANGNDNNSGTSPNQPWKRAPGDTLVTGVAASTVLKGGDVVRFKGGVHYRGQFRLRHSGTDGNPIIYTGTGYGTGSAIMDGSDPVTSAVKCKSKSACGGAANWRSLTLVTYTEPDVDVRKFFDNTGSLYESRFPYIDDPFWGDDREQYATVPLSKLSELEAGRLDNAELADMARDQPNARLSLWVYGNGIAEVKILEVVGSVIHFERGTLRFYDNRDTKASVVGSVKGLNKAGKYAVIGAGKAVVFPHAKSDLKFGVASGRYGFDVRGQSNITIHGFQFINGASSRGSIAQGVALRNGGSANRNVQLLANSFRNYSMQSGYGMVALNNTTNVTVRGNYLADLEGASGFRFGRSSNVVVEQNVMRKIGRTGIYFSGTQNAEVRNNILADMFGNHGNAISLYQDSQNIRVINNCAYNSTRPLTYKGKSGTGVNSRYYFENNIFITSPTGRSAVYSWGGQPENITFEHNLAVGSHRGFVLTGTDVGVVLRNNRATEMGISGSKTASANWVLQNNDFTTELSDVAGATLSERYCYAQGLKGPLSVSVTG